MKKLINTIDNVVPDLLHGLALGHPGIRLLPGHTIAVRADLDAMKARQEVALISGGGAGHEPAHAGYVGPGLLTAAVAGDVFTSPSTDAVLTAIEAVASPAGVLLIVKNYTGDRLNFGLAAEIARSRGIAVAMVVVADDAALAAQGEHAGRRGIAGTVLVHKIAGAAASAGGSLTQVQQAAQHAIDRVSTMGVALSSCTVPAAGTPSFTLDDNEVELGLGIHGEAGVRRTAIAPTSELLPSMLDVLIQDQSLQPGDRVALLVNNLGGTPSMELSIATGTALDYLDKQSIVVERAWSGTFLTALEMAGISLSLLKLDAALLQGLDAPAESSAWPAAHLGRIAARSAPPCATAQADSEPIRSADGPLPDTALVRALLAVLETLEASEPELTRMDQIVGDGDLGISLARGARAIRAEMGGYPLTDAAATLRALSATLRRALGGTSGPLYAIGLLRAAQSWSEQPGDGAAALQAAVDGIAEIGGAQQGDRTMLDALIPAAARWKEAAGQPLHTALAQAAQAADAGTAATAATVARRGRASYLGERAIGHADPGAKAVALWLHALARQSANESAA